jgi:TRAP-type transport system periplasmic protein
MMRCFIFLQRILVLLVLCLGFTAQALSSETWRFAIEEIHGGVQDAYAQRFKQLIEKKSAGEITLSIYPYGTLGTSHDITELVAIGVLQFANASPGLLGSFVPEMQVFSIPYLLSDKLDINRKMLDPKNLSYGILANELKQKNLKLVTMYPEGDQVWAMKREVRTPEDFHNFKIRVMASPMLVETYRAFGASPTPLPYSEVYGALQLNMIDGQVNPIFAIEEMKFYEVTDYLIWAGQQQYTTAVISSQHWYKSLSPEHQKMVDEATVEATDYIFNEQVRFNRERLKKIKQVKPGIKMITLTDQERDRFRKTSLILREKYVDMVGERGKNILDDMESILQASEHEK